MDENYDEFGNYIGPDIPEINDDEEDKHNEKENIFRESNENDEEEEDEDDRTERENKMQSMKIEGINTDIDKYNVILDEDKKEFPEAEEVYPNVENLVMEEDTQPITQPIINPQRPNKLDLFETELPQLTFDFTFLGHLMTFPKLIRNVAIAGGLQHGKTTIMDVLIHLTHNNSNITRYLDNREDEQKRKVSIKCSPISLVLPNSQGKHYLFNFIDTPGHSNFFDEVQSTFRVVDGVIIVIDILEGITLQTEKIIKEAIKEDLDIIVIFNKIDRFVLELKIPPNDAYFKIKYLIDEFR